MTHLLHFVVFLIPFANDRPLFLLVCFQSYQLKRVSYLLLQYFSFWHQVFQCLSVSVCLFLLCTGPCREVPVGAGGGAVWGSPGSNPAAGCMYLIRKETTKFIITSSTVKVLMNLVCVNNTAYIRLIMLVCRGTLALVWSYFGFLSHNFAFPSFI